MKRRLIFLLFISNIINNIVYAEENLPPLPTSNRILDDNQDKPSLQSQSGNALEEDVIFNEQDLPQFFLDEEGDDIEILELPIGFEDNEEDNLPAELSPPFEEEISNAITSESENLSLPKLPEDTNQNFSLLKETVLENKEEKEKVILKPAVISSPNSKNNVTKEISLTKEENQSDKNNFLAEEKDDVSQYTKEISNNRQNLNTIPLINTGKDNSRENQKTPDQIQFINNEVQVLILPDDDVVLGQVTQNARYELIDLRSYAKIFWSNYNKIKREPAKKKIESFIDNYDKKFN